MIEADKPMSTRFQINPEIIEWAIAKHSLNLNDVANRAGVKKQNICSWIKQEKSPTIKQLKNLAKALYIPQGYLFLSQPPEEEIKLPDFRTIGSTQFSAYSPELKDVLNSTLNKQAWLRDYLIANGQKPLSFLGKFSKRSNYAEVANNMSEVLQINDGLRKQASNPESFLRLVVKQCEDIGIIILRRGYPRDYTQRKLSVKEFRGFALCDEYAPFVFINYNDTKASQVFTLFHELAHVWINEEGISNVSLKEGSINQIETLCNAIAAEALVPADLFHKVWNQNIEIDDNLKRLTQKFRVSNLVILRRAYDLGVINKQQYDEKYAIFLAQYKKIEAQKKEQAKAKTGFGFKQPFFLMNSRLFSSHVVSAALNGDLLYRDAAQSLDKKNTEIIDKVATIFESEQQIG